MKTNNVIKIIVSIILIAIIALISIFGIKINDKTIIKGIKEINTGLDISGGVTIVYQAKQTDGVMISTEDLKKAETVIRKRLEAKNIFDYIVRTDENTKQISVDIPHKTDDPSRDPLEAVEGLDKTAQVTFRDNEGNILLSGEDIKDAKYSEEATDNTRLSSPHVVLEFNDNGSKKFAEATEKLVGKTMPIYLDDELLTEPIVNSKIESNTAIITMGQGSYSDKKVQAQEYAMLISSGALPFSLDVISKEYIGPYIGSQALDVSLKAGIIALILVCVIMIIIYRVPGFVSSIALIAYVSIELLVIANTGISITLPGIAGLILSIGMAVDANVIIFERIREELREKSGPKKSFEKGFKNAMTAIIDGNVTTFIIAILLYIFGIGSIKGFGIILALGVAISILTAVVVTKFILKQFMPLATKHKFLFAVKSKKEEVE